MTEAPDRIGGRLALVRRLMDLTQAEMAQRLTMPATRRNNYELGVSLIPVFEAIKLKRMLPGLTLDWVYEADWSKLTVELADRLTVVEALPEASLRRGRPRTRAGGQ